jgi:Ca-activated chloride channel family protein
VNVEARFDLHVVALQGEDDLTCLLTFQAPVPEDLADRPVETLVAVVDNSGSMQGARLSSVKQALHALVDRMRPQDTFCVVTFNTTAQVCVPTR